MDTFSQSVDRLASSRSAIRRCQQRFINLHHHFSRTVSSIVQSIPVVFITVPSSFVGPQNVRVSGQSAGNASQHKCVPKASEFAIIIIFPSFLYE